MRRYMPKRGLTSACSGGREASLSSLFGCNVAALLMRGVRPQSVSSATLNGQLNGVIR
jgi:hypothetical protein